MFLRALYNTLMKLSFTIFKKSLNKQLNSSSTELDVRQYTLKISNKEGTCSR